MQGEMQKDMGINMRKNYRDYTIGELLDMGYEIKMQRFNIPTIKEAEQETRIFDGVEISLETIRPREDWEMNFCVGEKEKLKIVNNVKLKK